MDASNSDRAAQSAFACTAAVARLRCMAPRQRMLCGAVLRLASPRVLAACPPDSGGQARRRVPQGANARRSIVRRGHAGEARGEHTVRAKKLKASYLQGTHSRAEHEEGLTLHAVPASAVVHQQRCAGCALQRSRCADRTAAYAAQATQRHGSFHRCAAKSGGGGVGKARTHSPAAGTPTCRRHLSVSRRAPHSHGGSHAQGEALASSTQPQRMATRSRRAACRVATARLQTASPPPARGRAACQSDTPRNTRQQGVGRNRRALVELDRAVRAVTRGVLERAGVVEVAADGKVAEPRLLHFANGAVSTMASGCLAGRRHGAQRREHAHAHAHGAAGGHYTSCAHNRSRRTCKRAYTRTERARVRACSRPHASRKPHRACR